MKAIIPQTTTCCFLITLLLGSFSPVYAQTALSYGNTVEGEITPAGDVDQYKFNGTNGDVDTIRFVKINGTFQLKVELYNSNNTLLNSSISGQIDRTLNSTGNYTVKVFGSTNSTTGNYSLGIQCVNHPVGAQTFNFGDDLFDNLTSFAEIETYSLNATVNDTITLRTARQSGESAYLDPYLELYAPNGTRVAYTASGQLDQKINTTGTYCLLLTDNARNGIGNYSLASQRVNNPVGAYTLNYGQAAEATLGSEADIKTYSLSANASDKITFHSARLINGPTYLDPYLELYAPNGTRISYASGGVLNAQVNTTGTYCLLVTDNARNSGGDFVLSSQRLNNPGNAVGLNIGETGTGITDSPATMSTYTFNATTSDKILIVEGIVNQTNGFYDSRIELYNATGSSVLNSTNGTIRQALNATGNYCLLVMDNAMNGIGTFDVTLQRPNNPANLHNFPYNTTIQGNLTHYSEIHAYNLTGTASQNISMCSGVQDGYGFFDVGIELYNGTGALLKSGTGSIQYTFPATGTYYVFISDNAHNGYGVYRTKVVLGNVSCTSIDLVDPTVTLYTPKPGEILESGQNYNITWRSTDDKGVSSQNIYLSTNSGASYNTTIASNLSSGASYYIWGVPSNLTTARARIKVTATDAQNNTGYDADKGDFAIINSTMPANRTNMTYQYDKENRLTQSYGANITYNYTYDGPGNRLNLTVY